jgi:hypothetical protein
VCGAGLPGGQPCGDQRRTVHVAMANEIEADVEASGLGCDPVGMRAHRRRVEGVHDAGVRVPAGGADVGRTASSVAWVRPARYTWAPAAAKALATVEPIEPAP